MSALHIGKLLLMKHHLLYNTKPGVWDQQMHDGFFTV